MNDKNLKTNDLKIGNNSFSIFIGWLINSSIILSLLFLIIQYKGINADFMIINYAAFLPESVLTGDILQKYKIYVSISNILCIIFIIAYIFIYREKYRYFAKDRNNEIINMWWIILAALVFRIFSAYMFTSELKPDPYDSPLAKFAILLYPAVFPGMNIFFTAFLIRFTEALISPTG